MIRASRRVVSWFGEWRRYCTLLALLFLARGVYLICVLPPFEGWDEYQHLAYIIHLVEQGRAPDLADAPTVSRSLYPALVAFPQCEKAREQLALIGVKTYDEFWRDGAPPSVRPDAPDVLLYQAQHPSLYYRLMTPIVRCFRHNGDVRSLISILRLINVGLGAASVFLVAMLLGQLIAASRLRYLLGMLIAFQPLYLINCARVANDALGVLLGTVAIGLILVTTQRHPKVGSFFGGAVLGAAILAKSVNLGLAPFGVVALIIQSRFDRIGARRMLLSVGLFLFGLGLTAGPFLSWNLSRYGVLTPLQEIVLYQASPTTSTDFIQTVGQIDWPDEISRRYERRSLWTGAWSSLAAPKALTHIHEYSVRFAMLGFLFAVSPLLRARRSLFIRRGSGLAVFALCASLAAGLCYHMVQSQMHLGFIATNMSYAAVSFPWLLCLYVQGLAYWPGRLVAPMGALILCGCFLGTELYGTFSTMVRTYSGGATGAKAWERLAELHPLWLSPTIAAVAVAVFAVLAMLGIGIALFNDERAQARRDNPTLCK